MRSGESAGPYGAVVAGLDSTASGGGASGGTVLDELAALGPFFAVGSHRPGATPVAPWRPVSELTDPTGATGPAGPLRDRMGAVRAALADRASGGSRATGEVEPRVAASALHLGLMARLVAPALGSAVLGNPDDMRPGGLWWQDEIGGPVPLSVPAPPSAPAVGGERLTPGEWGERFIDEIVAPVTAAIARLVSLSDCVLWGNVASAVNAAAAQVARQRPDLAGDAWHVAAGLFCSPRLSRERHPPGPGFRRLSCCLFYRLAPGSPSAICGDCVLGDRLRA
jgi:hypothetical protein